jgi:hypothetical protein
MRVCLSAQAFPAARTSCASATRSGTAGSPSPSRRAEVLGSLLLSVVASRRASGLLWAALALAGACTTFVLQGAYN